MALVAGREENQTNGTKVVKEEEAQPFEAPKRATVGAEGEV